MKNLDNLLEKYNIGHYNTNNHSDALSKFIEKKYDVKLAGLPKKCPLIPLWQRSHGITSLHTGNS